MAKRVLCAALVLLFALMPISVGEARQHDSIPILTSYRDIPGVTQDEILAIELLRERHEYFIYGMGHGDEAFYTITGEISGFAALMSQWLTEMFGIPFVPALFECLELIDAFECGHIHFTGQLGSGLGRARTYAMTSPIAKRSLVIVRPEGAGPLSEPLRFAFYNGSITANALSAAGVFDEFEAMFVTNPQEVKELLLSGQACAFFGDSVQTLNIAFPGFYVETFYPFVFVPVSFSTSDPDLAVIVNVVQKALRAGGMSILAELYAQGMEDLRRHRVSLLLDSHMREFIQNNPVIPIAAQGFGYPVSFYNRFENKYQGIAHDILRQVEMLTGLTFQIVHARPLALTEVLKELESGQIALATGVIRPRDTEAQLLWSSSFFTDHYALLSRYDFPNISINEVLYPSVGLVGGSAYDILFGQWFPEHVTVKRYSNLDAVLEALQYGEVDLAFSSLGGLQLLSNFHEAVGFKANLVFQEPYEIKFGISPNKPQLLNIINNALTVIDTHSISEEWMNRTFDYTVRMVEARIPWLVGAMLLLVCVVGLLVVMYYTKQSEGRRLKALVEERTAVLEVESAMLNTVFDSIPDIMFCQDLDLNYLRINKKYETMFNIKREDIIGKNAEVLGLPTDITEGWREVELSIIKHRSTVHIEESVSYFEGEPYVFETIKTPLVQNDKVIGLIGLARDITSRKEMEKELRAASLAKTAFIANMSHEIRTPMNSVVGFSELALENEMPPKIRSYLQKIIENANWLLQIINDILDVSKIESGKMELEEIPFDLDDIMAQCQSIILPKAMEKGIKLHFYKEPFKDNKLLMGDPVRMRQIITNILSNAVKFTNSGVIKVTSAIKEETDISKTLFYEITDTGIGMSPEQLDRIFEPFTQADVSITRKYGGTGLGLAIVKNLLDMMGSQLFIESTPGEGSKFSFQLTYNTVDSDVNTQQGRQARLHDLGKPYFDGEVLVCEDNEMNRLVIGEHLHRVGLLPVIVENGLVGLNKIKERIQTGQKPFDLILMDIHMPVMDGLDAAEKIMALNTGTPIVAMTANVMSADRELYKQCGMKDCVGKPFTSQELWSCLLKYLEPVKWDAKAGTSAGLQQYETSDELLSKLKTRFVHTNQNMFEEIAANIQKDVQLAHRQAHTLKGAAALIGKSNLQEAAADVEDLLKGGSNLVSERQLRRLETELSLVLEELKPLLGNEGDTRPKDFDPQRARELLEKLEPLLKSRNAKCLSMVNDIRRLPGSDELVNQLEAFDFKPALLTISKLKNKWGIG